MIGHLKANIIFPLLEKQQGRNISLKLKAIQDDYLLPEEKRKERQRLQVYRILQVARLKVPYYRRLFKTTGFDPTIILKDIRYLQELPFLTKDIVKEQEDQFINEDYSKKNLHLRRTGGSTGVSTKIYYDNEALDWTSAVNLFVLSQTGRKMHQTQFHLGNNSFPENNLTAELKRRLKHWATNRKNIETHSLDDLSLETIWTELRTKRPYVVQGHPSTMYALSKYIERSNLYDKNAIQAFEATGETLDCKKIKSIEQNIGCKVYNRYGNAEFGVMAHSRNNPNELEVVDFICYPESSSLGNGLDEIIMTTTTNFAMPLIRYKTGDIGVLSKTMNKDFISDIQGRIHDLIEFKGKLIPTHFIQDSLDSVGGVDEFQIILKPASPNLIKIVPNKETSEILVTQKLKQIFGEDIEITFTSFKGLVLSGWRDKFRFLINEKK